MDWDVYIKFCRGRDMSIPDVAGSCNWTLTKREASLRILDPIDYPDDVVVDQDVERTVVHELLHLHFAPFMEDYKPDDLEHIAKEQAIETIAKTLVNLKRETEAVS
jgi:hypothetical protein